MTGNFTKWERNSIKANVVMPIVFVVVALILVVVMFAFKPKPPETRKSDSGTSKETTQEVQKDDIDWENF